MGSCGQACQDLPAGRGRLSIEVLDVLRLLSSVDSLKRACRSYAEATRNERVNGTILVVRVRHLVFLQNGLRRAQQRHERRQVCTCLQGRRKGVREVLAQLPSLTLR